MNRLSISLIAMMMLTGCNSGGPALAPQPARSVPVSIEAVQNLGGPELGVGVGGCVQSCKAQAWSDYLICMKPIQAHWLTCKNQLESDREACSGNCHP